MSASNYPIPLAPPPDFSTDRRDDLLRHPSKMTLDQNMHVLTKGEMEGLRKQGFTQGLAQAVASNRHHFSLFMWIVDNSGSMNTYDGHKFVETKNSTMVRSVPCSRWEELQQTLSYHIRMSAVTRDATIFRLLNHPGAYYGDQIFSVAWPKSDDVSLARDVQNALNVVQKVRPGGVTPLTKHIDEIRVEVKNMVGQLSRTGKKVTIIIATDGIPTDEFGYEQKAEFIQALRSLEGLPLWVVIRLCTDDDAVVDFYNSLDDNIELSIEVLDDFEGEAEEVYQHNPWLNYTLPLHRCREMGFFHRVFDMIDERPLSRSDLRDYICLIFGDNGLDGMPDPTTDWDHFHRRVSDLVKKEKKQYNPITKKCEPWINMKVLNNVYGESSCCIS